MKTWIWTLTWFLMITLIIGLVFYVRGFSLSKLRASDDKKPTEKTVQQEPKKVVTQDIDLDGNQIKETIILKTYDKFASLEIFNKDGNQPFFYQNLGLKDSYLISRIDPTYGLPQLIIFRNMADDELSDKTKSFYHADIYRLQNHQYLNYWSVELPKSYAPDCFATITQDIAENKQKFAEALEQIQHFKALVDSDHWSEVAKMLDPRLKLTETMIRTEFRYIIFSIPWDRNDWFMSSISVGKNHSEEVFLFQFAQKNHNYLLTVSNGKIGFLELPISDQDLKKIFN